MKILVDYIAGFALGIYWQEEGVCLLLGPFVIVFADKKFLDER